MYVVILTQGVTKAYLSYVHTYTGDVMKESAQIALNWIRSNDHRVSGMMSCYRYTVYGAKF